MNYIDFFIDIYGDIPCNLRVIFNLKFIKKKIDYFKISSTKDREPVTSKQQR